MPNEDDATIEIEKDVENFRKVEQATIAQLQAEVRRLTDLVRYARHYLHDEHLISGQEFAALVADSDNGQRVARLEGYDGIARELVEARKDRDQRKAEAAVALAVLVRIGTPEQIHEATSAILASREPAQPSAEGGK